MTAMAEVIQHHSHLEWSFEYGGFICSECGWQETYARPHAQEAESEARAAHQAAALSAAGFGPVQEARAEALAEVAEDALEGLRASCPNETLAIGFMSGYAEAARDHADSVDAS